MPIWLPLALLGLLVVLLTAMPWHRPHPNHQFMLELMRLLADEPPSSLDSSSTGPQAPTGRTL